MGIIRLYLLGLKGLEVLLNTINEFEPCIISQVIVGSDKKILNDCSSEIIEVCRKNEIPYCSRQEDVIYTNDVSIAIGWKWLIDLSRVPNLITIHDSLLPKYRGFNPLVSALINGEKKIGATALFATLRYDEGDIIKQAHIQINYPIKILHAIEKVSKAYSSLTHYIIERLISGHELERKTQNSSEATYSIWRDEDDYFIDWNWDSAKIRRFVDAVGYPYDGAKCWLNNEVTRIDEVEECKDVFVENRTPGKIIFFEDNQPVVICGTGLLKIIDIRSADNSKIKIKKIRTRFK